VTVTGRTPHAGAPVVELLPQLEVEKALGRDDAVELAHPVGQVEQLPAVGADELDEDVELARGDHDVAGLVPLRDLVGDGLRRAAGADPDHRDRLEAEPERVGHAGDLQDVVLAEALVARTDRRLRDAQVGGDAPERLAAVLLQRLDQPLVDPVEVRRSADRAPPPLASLRSAQCEVLLAGLPRIAQARAGFAVTSGPVDEAVVPVLYVEDAGRAVAWYERLGFQKEWEHQFEPGFPWFVSVARGRVRLYLSEHTGDARPNTLIHLYVADVDRVAAEFDVTVDEEGLAGRECALEDPDGNRLRVATPRT
jgi:glyoxalase superfamily protein